MSRTNKSLGPRRRPNRAQRAIALLRCGWYSSLDLIHFVGSVAPQKVISEIRRMGIKLETRTFAGVREYRVAR